MAYRHVVFATDLTDAAQHGARVAAEQARCNGGRFTLLHVAEYFPQGTDNVPAGSEPEDYLRERGEAGLAGLAAEVGFPNAERAVLVTRESARQAILEYVHEQHADLVVVGALGHPGMLGTTVNGIAADPDCDLLIVHGAGYGPHAAGRA